MNFGIPKKFIYISLALLAFNMYAASTTYVASTEHNNFYKIAYITFPFWGAVMAGSLLGFLVLLFPTKQQYRAEIKYTRSKIVGILIANLVFVLLYIYKLFEFYGTTAANG